MKKKRKVQEGFFNKEGEYTITDMANKLGVNRDYLQYFIKFCKTTGYGNLPEPDRIFCNKTFYNKEKMLYILKIFKEKKRGDMTEFNIVKKNKWKIEKEKKKEVIK